MKLKSKLFASAVALTMVLSAVAVPASAQTTAELQAQIASLLAMINQLNAQLAAQGGTTVSAGTTFTMDLTIGSTGAEVTALQQWLVAKGFLSMPAGVAYGYFGTLTQSALAKYQTSVGISPAAGYFGPITRAKVNASAGTTTGGTTTGGTTTGGITTPGVEGTLSVTSNNSGLVSTIYEGDSMVPILGFNVEAKNSDIAVQRIKLNLGTQTKFYNAIYDKLYVTDGSNVLASVDLSSSTVVKDGSNYYVTIAGFNYVVSKGSKKQIVIKADVMASIDSADYDTETYPISLANDGVRGVDGAGIDQYSPATGSDVTRTPTVSASLTDSANLKVSLDNSSPLAQDVIASDGSGDNELDKLTLMTFNVKAEKDDLTLQDLTVNLTYSGSGTATATTLYLYDGSNELDNASVAATSATAASASFTDLGYVVPKDTTKTLTVKVDVRNADATIRTMLASVTSSGFTTVENTDGDNIGTGNVSGSATGYAMSVRSSGVEITLVSKSITTNGVPESSASNNLSTSTLTATFNVKVKAVGGDVYLGTVASSSNPLFSSANSFQLFKNGVAATYSISTSTSYTIPSTCTTDSTRANTCVLAEGSEITVPVTFQILGRTAAGAVLTSGLYSVELQRVNWAATSYSNFMDGDQNWKTADVSFP